MFYFFYKIIVLRDTGQFHSDLDHTTHMHMNTVRLYGLGQVTTIPKEWFLFWLRES
jgi:hypothetical protein